MAYAEGTSVDSDKSIGEIVGLVRKVGAERITQLDEPQGFAIQFFLNDRMLRFRIHWPRADEVPDRDGRGAQRSPQQRAGIAEQRKRQRARALLLVIKAKLESVESEVETFDEAFLPNIVMPDGETVGDLTLPRVTQAYLTGAQPTLMLPSYREK